MSVKTLEAEVTRREVMTTAAGNQSTPGRFCWSTKQILPLAESSISASLEAARTICTCTDQHVIHMNFANVPQPCDVNVLEMQKVLGGSVSSIDG